MMTEYFIIVCIILMISIFQFLSLLQNTPGLHSEHLNQFVTVFAPSNDALDNYHGEIDEQFILNHFGK